MGSPLLLLLSGASPKSGAAMVTTWSSTSPSAATPNGCSEPDELRRNRAKLVRVPIPAGTEIAAEKITSIDAISFGHKVAASVIKAGDGIHKYGQIIGFASRDIQAGEHVHVHNVEMKPGKGAQLARSAGASVQLVAREGQYATLRLRSGEMRKVPSLCKATIGEVSNSEHNLEKLGKAGAKRWRGVRPTVRGVAMNPVDHPHGGGEGKTSGGRHPVSPWGQPEGRTRKKNKASDRDIVRRRKTNRKR